MKEQTYSVKGMHCAACEVLIEKKLLEIPGVKAVDASTVNGKVTMEYENQKPRIETLNEMFSKDGYTFFHTEGGSSMGGDSEKPVNSTLAAFNIIIFLAIGYFLLEKVGISNLFNVNATSSLITFFGFGMLAGVSSCAALVGGIILSMSKQWNALYDGHKSTLHKLQPHFLFNVGRVLSYGLFGGLLGLLGGKLQLSLTTLSFLVLGVSLFMLGTGLQMLGVTAFRNFQFTLPKFVTRKLADEKNFKGKQMPFLMGAATFFLPCGFTVSVQSLALLSGSWISGALMLAFFALGTAPALLAIGLGSVKLLSKPSWSEIFSKVAGFLLVIFALYNGYNQAMALGIVGQNQKGQTQTASQKATAPIVNGKQVLKMTVYASKYEPSSFTVKAGVPVKWEVTSSGQPSCSAGAIVSTLLDKAFYLDPTAGALNVVEFTPKKAGKYSFSCTMGMYRGTITVVN